MLDKKIIAFFRQWLDGYFVMKALVQHLSFTKLENIRETKDALAVANGMTDISLYLNIGESLYSAFGTAMGGWVEAKLVSQVITFCQSK